MNNEQSKWKYKERKRGKVQASWWEVRTSIATVHLRYCEALISVI